MNWMKTNQKLAGMHVMMKENAGLIAWMHKIPRRKAKLCSHSRSERCKNSLASSEAAEKTFKFDKNISLLLMS